MNSGQAGNLDRRLARVEGQVRGLRRMVGEGAYCIDILNQLSAVQAALDQFGANLATRHVETCILGARGSGKHSHAEEMTQEEMLAELQRTLSRLMR